MIFRNWVLQNFPFLEDDFDALTDYELFCKMVEYMKESLKNVESFKSKLDSFQVQLDEYKNYFDNLDVQEEINNKLDEMAESGQLQEIIAEYLNLITNLVFNTVQDMKTAENLVNGIYVKTLGFYETGDGGSAYYHIRNVTNEDVIDEHFIIAVNDVNLVAEFIMIGKDLHSKQVGLKGDDETDETEILQKFFDYKNNYQINKIVDEGIYLTSDTINLVGKDQQDGNDGSGYQNGFASIKFNNATIHHANGSEDDYDFKIYKWWEDCIDGLSVTRNTGRTKVLISGCYRLLFKNFEVKSLEINTDPSLIDETLRFYWCSGCIFDNGYIRGKLIINPYNQLTHFINIVNFENVKFMSYGQSRNVLLLKSFSKQQINFISCDFSNSNDCIFEVDERQVNPYLSTGVGSCTINCLNNYYDSNVKLFKNNIHNNITFNEFGSRYSGDETLNGSQITEDYFSTTKLGINSNHVRSQLPISNLNLCYNGTIKSHTLEDSNTERIFGASTANITKSYVEKVNTARYNYARRLVFETTSDTYQIAQATAFHYKGTATAGIVFEVVSGGCDLKFVIGYVDQQYETLKKEDIHTGLNIFTYCKQSQIFNEGSWADLKIMFENIEEGTVIDIYEVGVQTGEIYMLNAPCKGD